MNPYWTWEETLAAFYVYSQIPYGKVSLSCREVINLSELLGQRSVGSVKAKLGNIHSASPVTIRLGQKGLSHVGKLEKKVWQDYEKEPDDLMAQAMDVLKGKGFNCGEVLVEPCSYPEGADIITLVRARAHQNIFRNEIVRAYGGKCCITGISDTNLLNASHIKPWVKCDGREKTSVNNGLCLNTLHDRLFDRGIITVDSDLKLVFSKKLKNGLDAGVYGQFEHFIGVDGQKLLMANTPVHFQPDRKFLEFHHNYIFLDNVH